MVKFEKVSRFKDADIKMPARSTAKSAGYDLPVAEDIVIPSYISQVQEMNTVGTPGLYLKNAFTLDEMKDLTKRFEIKPTLVSTGLKCYLDDDKYLELSVRSSTPLKYWLLMANSEGIIDADYADNPDNEGEIFLQMINLSPFDIQLKAGDCIGQGIIKTYYVTDDDIAQGDRLGGFGSTS